MIVYVSVPAPGVMPGKIVVSDAAPVRDPARKGDVGRVVAVRCNEPDAVIVTLDLDDGWAREYLSRSSPVF